VTANPNASDCKVACEAHPNASGATQRTCFEDGGTTVCAGCIFTGILR
jgi:hypothetical protein